MRYWKFLGFCLIIVLIVVEIVNHTQSIQTIDPKVDSANITGVIANIHLEHGNVHLTLANNTSIDIVPEAIDPVSMDFQSNVHLGDTISKDPLSDSVSLKRGNMYRSWRIVRIYPGFSNDSNIELNQKTSIR